MLLLCQAGVLASLVDLSFIDSRPAVLLAEHESGAGRYEQALYPVLVFLTAMLSVPTDSSSSAPSTPNADVLRHAAEFVSSHSQCLVDVLQDGLSTPTLSSLRLLRAAASLFAALAPFLENPPPQMLRLWTRFRDLLLQLAHKYAAFPDVEVWFII